MKYLAIILAFLTVTAPVMAQESQKTETQQKIDAQFKSAQKLFTQDNCKEALRCLTDSVNIKLGLPNSEFNEQQKELYDAIQLCLKIQYQMDFIALKLRLAKICIVFEQFESAADEWHQGKQFMIENKLNIPKEWLELKKEIDKQINIQRLKKTS